MPAKVDSKIVADMGKQLKERKEGHSRSMSNVMSGYITKNFDINEAMNNIKVPSTKEFPIENVQLDKIHVRKEGNFFEQSNIGSLKESIRACGLIDPIQLLKAEDGYHIIAGHRRFTAYSRLHEEDGDVFKAIPAIVYQLTDDKDMNLQVSENKEFVWITKETEERIYEDSNLESRQLTYSEVARYVVHILERLENADYRKKILENIERKWNSEKIDKSQQICKILESYNYTGWSKTTIQRFLKIYDTSKYSDFVEKKLNNIINSTEENKVSVLTVFKECKTDIDLYSLLNASTKTEKKFSSSQNKWRKEWQSLENDEEKKHYFNNLVEVQKNKLSEVEQKKTNKQFVALRKQIEKFSEEDTDYSQEEKDEIKKWIKILKGKL